MNSGSPTISPSSDGEVEGGFEELRPLGELWESCDPRNRWEGFFRWADGSRFYDTPHFETRRVAGVQG